MKQDMDILKDIYKVTAGIVSLCAACSLILNKPWVALSIILGACLMTGILYAFQWVATRSFTPSAKRPKLAMYMLIALKYPLLAVFLYGIVSWNSLSIPAFCGGVLLVHVAIVIRVGASRTYERIFAPKPVSLANQNNGGES